MNLKDVKKQLSAIGVTIKTIEGTEYRINFKGGSEASAYYTDDLEDALITGKVMAERQEINDKHST